jgi:hypothetical protein
MALVVTLWQRQGVAVPAVREARAERPPSQVNRWRSVGEVVEAVVPRPERVALAAAVRGRGATRSSVVLASTGVAAGAVAQGGTPQVETGAVESLLCRIPLAEGSVVHAQIGESAGQGNLCNTRYVGQGGAEEGPAVTAPEYNVHRQLVGPRRHVNMWCFVDGIGLILLIGFVLVVGAFFIAAAGIVGLIFFTLLVTIPFVLLAA